MEFLLSCQVKNILRENNDLTNKEGYKIRYHSIGEFFAFLGWEYQGQNQVLSWNIFERKFWTKFNLHLLNPKALPRSICLCQSVNVIDLKG